MPQLAILLVLLATALAGCATEDCRTSDTSVPSPDGTIVATDRHISCGGAAGANEGRVLLRLADGTAEADVVVRANHVNGLRWADPQTLIVGVDTIDEHGDPVRDQTDRWTVREGERGERQVRVVLERQVLDG